MTVAVAFREVVPSPAQIMGVKAVWGRSGEAVMCFGSRGDAAKKGPKHFQTAKSTAKRALAKPFIVSIGGGEQVSDDLRGRVVEIVRATPAYGETEAFVHDGKLRELLKQWPVAVLTSETYSVEGEPLVMEDLGFPDRRILEFAYDTVKRDEGDVERLWKALDGRMLSRRWEISPPVGFASPAKVQLCSSMIPIISAKEGQRRYELALTIERDSTIKNAAKALNRDRNGGVLICEACDFTDETAAMFDVHHLRPISAGERVSRVDDLAVLCPTCHRFAHWKSQERWLPLPVSTVASMRGKLAA